MQFRDLNFEKDIGANGLWVKMGSFQIVVDCGMDPKRMGHAAIPNFSLLEEGSIDVILITHCHLDHLGALPLLARKQPQAKILMTYPAAMIAPTMLLNSFTVMCRQKEENDVPEYPLYTKKEVEQLVSRFEVVPFNHKKRFLKGKEPLDIMFLPAGHVLGAASILVNHKNKKTFFTGDILFSDQHTLKGASNDIKTVDTLFIETTRGKTERLANRRKEELRLLRTINRTLKKGGACLIPAFAFGRMQELLQLLYKAKKDKKLVDCPIYCSGLGMSLVDTFDQIGKKTKLVQFKKSILKTLKVKSLPKKKMVPGMESPGPAIYLLSSGMLIENTPSYQVGACLISDRKNTICFVGYCDPDTPGGKLLNTKPDEEFLFEEINYQTRVKAGIEHFDLSGHADREELLAFAVDCQARTIILTHGGIEARQWFTDSFAQINVDNRLRILNPEPGLLNDLGIED